MMMVLFIVPFALQAQTKFHDVEANDAKGAVKSITVSAMGQTQKHTFTPEGKEETLKNPVYDENGYLQSAEMDAQGMTMKVSYKWENGKVKSQTMNVMDQEQLDQSQDFRDGTEHRDSPHHRVLLKRKRLFSDYTNREQAAHEVQPVFL